MIHEDSAHILFLAASTCLQVARVIPALDPFFDDFTHVLVTN